MKKIMLVTSCLGEGGAERVMTLIANELSNRNYSVDMVLVRGWKEDAYKVNNTVNVIRLLYKSNKKAFIAVSRVKQLRKIIATGKYDAIISFAFDINCAVILAGLGLKTPIIVSERNDPRIRWKKAWLKRLEILLYNKVAHIVFQTDYVKTLYPTNLQEKSSVIPNPVNPELPIRFTGEREKVISAVGRLEEQKNFGLLIRTFARFHQKHPGYKLCIYGRGSQEDEMREFVWNCGVGDCVDMPGYVDDVIERVRKTTVYVSTSNYEGISNSMIEALAVGMPTICTDCPVGGARLMIEDGVNGILIGVNDDAGLYNALEKITLDKNFAERIGTKAFNIRYEYSVANIVDQWVRVIDVLI